MGRRSPALPCGEVALNTNASDDSVRSSIVFFLVCAAIGAIVFGVARLIDNDYLFFAGYVVLQYIVLATAWNILGGYTGYVNLARRRSSRSALMPRCSCTRSIRRCRSLR